MKINQHKVYDILKIATIIPKHLWICKQVFKKINLKYTVPKTKSIFIFPMIRSASWSFWPSHLLLLHKQNILDTLISSIFQLCFSPVSTQCTLQLLSTLKSILRYSAYSNQANTIFT